MTEREFIGRDKTRAAKKVLDFWYRHFKDWMSLKQFLAGCRWKDGGEGSAIIVYRGPIPPSNKGRLWTMV